MSVEGNRHEWVPTARRHQRRLGTQVFQRKDCCDFRSQCCPNTCHLQNFSRLISSDGATVHPRKIPGLVLTSSNDGEYILSLSETSKCNVVRVHSYFRVSLGEFVVLWSLFSGLFSFHYTDRRQQEGQSHSYRQQCSHQQSGPFPCRSKDLDVDLAQTAANLGVIFLVNSVDGLSQCELVVLTWLQRIHALGYQKYKG